MEIRTEEMLWAGLHAGPVQVLHNNVIPRKQRYSKKNTNVFYLKQENDGITSSGPKSPTQTVRGRSGPSLGADKC